MRLYRVCPVLQGVAVATKYIAPSEPLQNTSDVMFVAGIGAAAGSACSFSSSVMARRPYAVAPTRRLAAVMPVTVRFFGVMSAEVDGWVTV